MQGRHLLIAAACACAFAAGAGYWRGAHRQDATLQSMQHRLEATESRLARLEAGAVAPRHDVARTSPPKPVAAVPPRDTPDLPDALAPAQLHARMQRLQSTLESAFRARDVDPAWAPSAERELLRAASAPELGVVQSPPTDVRAQCRRTACRVQARFADAAELETWLQAYLLVAVEAIARSETVQVREHDGSTLLTIYGARP